MFNFSTRLIGPFLATVLTLSTFPGKTDAKEVRNYIFGHSLINHVSDTPQTVVPYWLNQLAKAAGHSYRMDGQFEAMFFRNALPPNSSWWVEGVQSNWNMGSGRPFGDADYTHVTITAINFAQYQGPTSLYDGDNPLRVSPVTDALEVIDWLTEREPGVEIQIYVNWPEMAEYIRDFPPSPRNFAKYNAATAGSFADWFDTYYNAIKKARPDVNLSSIPVGPVMAGLFTSILSEVPPADLYVDSAPHGTPTLYFLASLVTYVHMYKERPPANFKIPRSINPIVRERYSEIIEAIWERRNRAVVAKAMPLTNEKSASDQTPPSSFRAGSVMAPQFRAEYFALESMPESLADISFARKPDFVEDLDALETRYRSQTYKSEGLRSPVASRVTTTLPINTEGDYVFF